MVQQKIDEPNRRGGCNAGEEEGLRRLPSARGQGWEMVGIDKRDDDGHDGGGTAARMTMVGRKIWRNDRQ